jgi:hypothetical protein
MISIVQMPIELKLFLVIELSDVHAVVLIIFSLMLVSNLSKFYSLDVFDNNHEHVLDKFIQIFSNKLFFLYFYEHFFVVDIPYKLPTR